MSRQRIMYFTLVLFGVIHLSATIASVWTSIMYKYPKSIGRWLGIYMNYAGSTYDYTYFAPSVANAMRTVCIVKDSSGSIQVYNVGTSDKAAKINFDCLLSSCMNKPEGLDLFSQSLAAFYLSYHPYNSQATIVSQTYLIPSLKAYQNGERPIWKTFYTGTFMAKISK